MFRTAVMMAASLALTGAVVAHAYYLKHQFYPTVVYLTKSSPSMAVSLGLGKEELLGREGGACRGQGPVYRSGKWARRASSCQTLMRTWGGSCVIRATQKKEEGDLKLELELFLTPRSCTSRPLSLSSSWAR